MCGRRQREAAERLLGSEVTGRASRRQRDHDVHGDRRHAAGCRQAHASSHWRQFHEVIGHVVAGCRQRRHQGVILSARTLPCTLPRY